MNRAIFTTNTNIPTIVTSQQSTKDLSLYRPTSAQAHSNQKCVGPTHLLAPGSIPELGSSSSRTGGPPIKAMANDSLRLLPPLSVPANCFSVGPRLTADNAAVASLWSESGVPVVPQEHGEKASSLRRRTVCTAFCCSLSAFDVSDTVQYRARPSAVSMRSSVGGCIWQGNNMHGSIRIIRY